MKECIYLRQTECGDADPAADAENVRVARNGSRNGNFVQSLRAGVGNVENQSEVRLHVDWIIGGTVILLDRKRVYDERT